MTALPSSGWMRTAGDGAEHIVPLGDLRVHDLTPTCWCNPFTPPDAEDVWAHNALDERDTKQER